MKDKTANKRSFTNLLIQIIRIIAPMQEDFKIYKYYLRNNKILVIWIIAYFLLFWSIKGFTINAFFMLIIMYYISIKVSVSDLGELILRSLQDSRLLSTSKEKNRLMPTFEEVYKRALEASPYLEKDIQLYIIDTITPNAFAIGRKSVIVTKGLMDMMTDEEIKAILAHEFAHIANGDTIISIIFTLGNTVFMGMLIILQVILTQMENYITSNSNLPIGWLVSLIKALMGIAIFIFTSIGTGLLMINSRQREYKADMYSCNLGYGNSLITGLYKIYDYSMSSPLKLSDRIQQTHPRTAYRIGKLEEQLGTISKE